MFICHFMPFNWIFGTRCESALAPTVVIGVGVECSVSASLYSNDCVSRVTCHFCFKISPFLYVLPIIQTNIWIFNRQCIQPHACVFTIQPHACGSILNPGFWIPPHVWWLHRVKSVQPRFLVKTLSIVWRNKAVSLLTKKIGVPRAVSQS